MFSRRIPDDLTPNRLTREVARRRQSGLEILDLTVSNPTQVDIAYPDNLLDPLADARGLSYRPEPLGLSSARRAVAGDFARRGIHVRADDLALTASTSEAYSLAFKILCDPGQRVLVPRPSYPLFEHLTRLESVVAAPYNLEYHGAWAIDLDGLARAFTPDTRAVLIVNPNNPTGSFVSEAELDAIAALCRAYDAAIIADEVFAEYELTPGAAAAAGGLTRRSDVLGFTLGGLSKSIGLPQAKLAWMALSGPPDLVRAARARLELVCDTYLSVSTPIQASVAELLQRGAEVRRQIQRRILDNAERLRVMIEGHPSCALLKVDGGWYAVIQVPTLMPEEDLTLSLLTDQGVLVHPGYFFDFPKESFLVVSLLTPVATFADGVARVVGRFHDQTS